MDKLSELHATLDEFDPADPDPTIDTVVELLEGCSYVEAHPVLNAERFIEWADDNSAAIRAWYLRQIERQVKA